MMTGGTPILGNHHIPTLVGFIMCNPALTCAHPIGFLLDFPTGDVKKRGASVPRLPCHSVGSAGKSFGIGTQK